MLDCPKNKEEKELNVMERQINNGRELTRYVLLVVSLDIVLQSPDAVPTRIVQ
jgi:hypothetical protein